MKNKSIKSKILAGVLMASIMVSATGVFAATSADKTNNAANSSVTRSRGEHKGNFKTILDNLVSDGTLTSDKATAIQTALDQKHADKPISIDKKLGDKDGDRFKSKLDALVSDGTLTSDEAAAIQTALAGADRGNFKTVLDDLVTAGTITSNKATAIENSFGKRPGDKGGDKFKTKLDALVSAGTLTSDEATSIQTALAGANRGDFKTVLDNLVTAGTITSDKATAIENSFGKKPGDKGGDRFKAQLDALVTDGTITSDEEAAIIAAIDNAK